MPNKSRVNVAKWDDFSMLVARCQNHCGTLASELQLIAETAFNLRLMALTPSQHRNSDLYKKVWNLPKTSPRRRAKGSKTSTRKAAKAANGKEKLSVRHSSDEKIPGYKWSPVTERYHRVVKPKKKPKRDRHAF